MNFEELQELSKSLSLDELTKIVERTITSVGGYQISSWTNLIVPRLYRGRNHNYVEGNVKNNELHKFTNECEFWNPPVATLQERGRCNDIGESLLYVSNNWETAILETRPIKGNYISVSIYNAKENPANPNELLGSRIIPIGIQYLSKIDSLKNNDMFKDYDFANRKAEFFELDNFLDELFHKEVGEDEKHLYKLSVAVTKCMMNNILTDSGATLQRHGMMYPSIVHNKHSYNFIIRPIHARTIYKLFQVQTFKVIESSDSKIVLQLMRDGMTTGTKNHPLEFFEMTWFDVSSAAVFDEIFIN